MVPRRLMVKGQIATLIGIPLAACTLVADVILLIWLYAGGVPPLHHTLLGHGVAMLLSIAVLWIALRAWHRTRRGRGSSSSRRLTLTVPFLVAIGVASGLFVGNAWGHHAVAIDRRVLTDMCEELLPAGPHGAPAPAALTSCIEVANECRKVGAAAEGESRVQRSGGMWPNGAWFACVKGRLPSVR